MEHNNDGLTSNNVATSSDPTEKSVAISGRKQFFENLPLFFNNLEKSRLFRPDMLFNYLDICAEIPPIDKLCDQAEFRPRYPLHNAGDIDLGANALRLNMMTRPIPLTMDSQVSWWEEVNFERPLNSLEQQLAIQIHSYITSEGNAQIVRNNFSNDFQQLMPIFADQVPSQQYTTYNYQLIARFCCHHTPTQGGVLFSVIGIYTLAQTLINSPRFLATYYPVLWTNYKPGALQLISPLAESIDAKFAREPLFVLTESTSARDALAQTQTVAGQIGQAAYFGEQLVNTTIEDRKMMVIGYDTTLNWLALPQEHQPLKVPIYNFRNHVLVWMASLNHATDRIILDHNHFLSAYVWMVWEYFDNLVKQRIMEYASLSSLWSIYVESSPARVILFNNRFTQQVYTQWCLQYWVPYEEILYRFNIQPLAVPLKYHEDIFVKGRLSDIHVYQLKMEDDRLPYIPAILLSVTAGAGAHIHNELVDNNSNAPVFGDGAALAAGATQFQQVLNWEVEQVAPWRHFAPIAQHIHWPVNMGADLSANGGLLQFRNYYRLPASAFPNRENALPGDAEDIQFRSVNSKVIVPESSQLSGISFLGL